MAGTSRHSIGESSRTTWTPATGILIVMLRAERASSAEDQFRKDFVAAGTGSGSQHP